MIVLMENSRLIDSAMVATAGCFRRIDSTRDNVSVDAGDGRGDG